MSNRGQIGQSAKIQIDCLSDIGKLLGNENNRLWSMRNGYCFPTDSGIDFISEQLRELDSAGLGEIQGKLRIGHQFKTEVTSGDSNHVVTQAFCSALPVAYSPIPQDRWAPFASLVLDAAYEATFSAAVSNFSKTGCNKLFLTLLGGGCVWQQYGVDTCSDPSFGAIVFGFRIKRFNCQPQPQEQRHRGHAFNDWRGHRKFHGVNLVQSMTCTQRSESVNRGG